MRRESIRGARSHAGRVVRVLNSTPSTKVGQRSSNWRQSPTVTRFKAQPDTTRYDAQPSSPVFHHDCNNAEKRNVSPQRGLLKEIPEAAIMTIDSVRTFEQVASSKLSSGRNTPKPPPQVWNAVEPPFKGYQPPPVEGYQHSSASTAIVIDNGKSKHKPVAT